MTTWNPDYILQERGFRITGAEKQDILRRMPPPSAQDGQIYIDGVFEGGGVRGIAFLGALRCMADLGFRWRKVAGTSAGAITAALVAANCSIESLEEIIGGMDYTQFLTYKTSRLILNGDPTNDLRSPVWMILNLLLARQLGQYSSDPFRDWMAHILHAQGLQSFADVKRRNPGADLKVVVSDISRGEMLVLPDDLSLESALNNGRGSLMRQLRLNHAEDFSIAEGVRLSMSIPFFFAPGRLGNRKIIDGGILSNFPLWIYDTKQPQVSGDRPNCPRWPTFGLRLLEVNPERTRTIRGPFGMLAAMFNTMMVARDQYHLSQANQGRVINIDVTSADVTATEFRLSPEKKERLYRLGYLHTKQFFQTWDWHEHLRLRGHDPRLLVP